MSRNINPELNKATAEKPVKVDLSKRITLYATDKAVYYKPGEKFDASELLAAEMIKKGHASLEEFKPKKEKDKE